MDDVIFIKEESRISPRPALGPGICTGFWMLPEKTKCLEIRLLVPKQKPKTANRRHAPQTQGDQDCRARMLP